MTTIQPPTPSARQMASRLAEASMRFLVVGDAKGPAGYDLAGVDFLSLDDQLQGGFELARALPTGCYARKNLGYLEAIRRGARQIYETDDDNAPLPTWILREQTVTARPVEQTGWINVYRCFTEQRIWPRGFPLDAITATIPTPPATGRPSTVAAPIQQGLANGSPDVDAIWRLVLDEPFAFRSGESVLLPPGAWCPFNSQSTWWWPEAYPLLYLPSHCSFRMTDIWRSLVAQRCLWAMDRGLVFHAPEVEHERNHHDLMADFEGEMPGYRSNRAIAETLEALELEAGGDSAPRNLARCYEALVKAGFLPREELPLVHAWLAELETMGS